MESENIHKVTWTDADDELLITMIEANPALWNTKRRDYRDAIKKQRLLMEISLAFPGSTPMSVEKRFIALKEKLRREKKKEDFSSRSGAGASTSSRWHLLPKLEFLAQTMQPRLTICSDPRPGSSSLDSICENSPNLSSSPTSPTSPTPNLDLPQFTSTPPTGIKCPPRSLKTTQTLRAEFFKKGMETIEKIGDTAANLQSTLPFTSIAPVGHLQTPEEKRGSHFSVLDYIGQECSSMSPDDRNNLMHDLLEVFWKYKLPK